MPRPFAVIGITVFLVLMALSGVSSKLVLAALAVFTAALLISLFTRNIRRQPVFPVAFASAAVACLLLLAVNEFYYYPLLRMAEKTCCADILITDECEKKYGNFYYKGSVSSADGEKIHADVYLCFSSAPDLRPYDRVKGNFRFYKLGRTNEDTAASRKAENRFLGAYPAHDGYEISADTSFHLNKAAVAGRGAIRKTLLRLLPNDFGGLWAAMLTGDRSSLSDSAYTALRKCGISHLICVSGLHLSLWTSAILWFLKKLRLGEKAACALAVPAVLFLMAFMGMTYSVIRSGIMMLIYLVSVLLSQRKDSLNSLGIALVFICVSNPFSPGHLSLQLSALSTLGIITAGEYLFPEIDAFFEKHARIQFLKKITDSLLVTFSAVVFTLPVILPLMGGFNFGVFPSNLLTVILAEACMVCAVFGVLIGLVSTGIVNLPAFAAGLCAKAILGISSKVSRIDFLQFNLCERDIYIILCGLFAFCALAVLTALSGKKIIPGSACFLSGIFILTLSFYSYMDSLVTKITVFDTGNGSAVMISKDGENILFGCGGDGFNGAGNIRDALALSGGNLDWLFIPREGERYSSYLPDLAKTVTPVKAVCNGAGYVSELALGESMISSPGDEIHTRSAVIRILTDKNGKTFYIFRNGDLSAVILPEPLTDLTGFEAETEDCGFMITSMDFPDGADFSSLKAAVIQAGSPRGEKVRDELLSQGISAYVVSRDGNLVIEARGGKAGIRRG